MSGVKKEVPKKVVVESRLLAEMLMSVGDGIASLQKKVYAVTRDRLDKIGRTIRIILEAEDEQDRNG